MFLDCGIHAREWVSPAFCLYVIDRLLDPSESAMTEKFDYYLMPNANPDGYVYTWGKNRFGFYKGGSWTTLVQGPYSQTVYGNSKIFT